MTQCCEGECVVRCCAISLGPSADVFYMKSKTLTGPPGQRHRAQVINMPRLMSSPSTAFAPLTLRVHLGGESLSLNYCCWSMETIPHAVPLL